MPTCPNCKTRHESKISSWCETCRKFQDILMEEWQEEQDYPSGLSIIGKYADFSAAYARAIKRYEKEGKD